MNRMLRIFIITPLLLLSMIVLPIVTLATDGFMSSDGLQQVLAQSESPLENDNGSQEERSQNDSGESVVDEGISGEGTSDRGTPDDGTSEDGASDQGTSGDGTSNDDTSEDGTSDEGTSDEGTSDESASDEGASGEDASDEGTSGEGASDEGASDEGASDEGASDEGASDESASDESASDEGTSGEGASDEGASDEGASDESASDEGASDEGASDEGASDEGASDEGASDEGASDEGTSGEGASDEGASDESASDEGTSGEGASDEGASDVEQNTPTPTPTFTPTPTRRTAVLPPRMPMPAATRVIPTPMIVRPTATPTAPSSALLLAGARVEKVINDRFSDVIYAYANGWLYRSDNDGQTWRMITSMPQVMNFVMNATNPDILYSSPVKPCAENEEKMHDKMLKSLDGGVTWTELPNSANLRPILSDVFDPDVLYATDCDWLYASTDGGLTWSQRPDLNSEAFWTNYQVDRMAAVFLSDRQPGVVNQDSIYAGAIAKDGSGLVAYSNDMGETWTRVTPNIYPAPFGLSMLTADPFDTGRVWFADAKGVWESLDNGETWHFTNEGLLNVVDRDIPGLEVGIFSLIVHPSDQIYLGTVRGIYSKPVNGTVWRKVVGTAFDHLTISEILFTETNPNLLYLNTSEGVHLVRIEG
ncbi:hypothetical protein KFU94_24405 [Chloroflexi bacterium TSY]|nr:hypothetical protein [Chloroflexi bacterium TSY]